MKKLILSTIVLGLFMASCGGEEEATAEAKGDSKEEKVENCLYSYNEANSKLDWTAYKFIRKAGVDGTFLTINVTGDETAGDAKSLIESLSFTIPIKSIETNDPSRNDKIAEFFFGNLSNTGEIVGKVVSLGDDDKATLEITMNDMTKEVVGDFVLSDSKFTYTTEIDVNEWNAQAGLEALNNECKDLHTDVEKGDTESKLWPDVTISFTTTLSKTCD